MCLDFRPDVYLVAAAQAAFFDGAAGCLAAAVSAEIESLFACSRHDLAPINRNRTIDSLSGFLDRLQIHADFRNGVFHASGCWANDENLVSYLERL